MPISQRKQSYPSVSSAAFRATFEAWLQQAEHNAEISRLLAEHGHWSDAILLAFDAIELALKAMEAVPSAARSLLGEDGVPKSHRFVTILGGDIKYLPERLARGHGLAGREALSGLQSAV